MCTENERDSSNCTSAKEDSVVISENKRDRMPNKIFSKKCGLRPFVSSQPIYEEKASDFTHNISSFSPLSHAWNMLLVQNHFPSYLLTLIVGYFPLKIEVDAVADKVWFFVFLSLRIGMSFS